MFSSKMFSVGSICLLFACLLFVVFVGGVNAQSYDVTYVANFPSGASGSGSAPVDPLSPYASGSTATVLGIGDLAVDGYVFIGWGPNNPNSASPRQPGYTFSVTSSIVFYAMWEKDLSPSPSPSPTSPVDVGGIVGVGSLFLLFGVLVLVVWVLAVFRGSVGMCALSSGLWIAFGFGLMIVGEPGNGFVVGFTYISFLLGIVMAVSMFWEIYRMTVKKRSVEGGIFA